MLFLQRGKAKSGGAVQMKQKRKHRIPPVIAPAGLRADSLRPGNVPTPDEQRVEEEHRWREEHIQ